jgi:hypothetical protein
MFGSKRITTIAATALVLGMGFSAASFADRGGNDEEVQLAINPDTIVLIGKSDITEGGVTGFDCMNYTTGVAADCVLADGTPWVGVGFPANPATIHWAYSGDVYSMEVDEDTGEMKELGSKIGTVTGTPSFPASFGVFTQTGDPLVASQMVQSETLPWTCTSCNLEINGSTFTRIENMPLTGRSFIGLGGVDSEEGYLALRMAGCAGIQETSGEGPYANMQGTICLNGTIGFNPDFSGVGTSNCVMVLQKGTTDDGYVSPLAP